ncbi:MAG: heavy metal translocating P-type ATPase [Verrucomicrobiota bacterium]
MAATRDQTIHAKPAPSTQLQIGGMTCQNCARHVTEAIQNVAGVSRVNVELPDRAEITWQPGAQTDPSKLIEAIESAGYQARPVAKTSLLTVRGMTCSGCVRSVNQALQHVAGVRSVSVSLEQNQATVQWQAEAAPDPNALVESVRRAGYEAEWLAEPMSRSTRSSWSPFAGWKFNVVIGSILTLPLLVFEWVLGVGMERWYHWLAFFLVLPIQVFGGARFYLGAWSQLKMGSSNMDTLVALGSTTAFVYSVWGLFSGWTGHLFFMESAAIITLISVGHWLETKVSARAASSLKALLNLAPQTARRLGPDGSETEVPVAELRQEDRVVLKPGDRVPTDGEVIEGASAVDESMLTGESLPVDKKPGAKLFAGTANQSGRLLMRVTAIGEETALAHIIEIVQRAQSSRANIQKLGDRVSSVFVPIVVMIALGTALWWGLAPESALLVTQWLEPFLWKAHTPAGPLASAVYHAAAVLIIACPCAMGLATPVAIMAGTNVAARAGILIRDGVALEKSGRLTAVVFDKTGTLTQGKASVAAIHAVASSHLDARDIQSLAAALAKPSNHPLSRAVAAQGDGKFKVQDWQEIRGAGVEATLHDDRNGGAHFRLGSLAWLKQNQISVSPAESWIQEWSSQGATLLGLTRDQELVGLIALRDQIKAHAADVVTRLHRQGKKTFLITGDNDLTAFAIADQVGIPRDQVFAQIRPERKAEIVRELQGQGERLAFIGDGINDAPALEQADLGVAVSQASDVAREAADIILLKSDIQAIPEALGLAQATLRTIKQNLFWAFFYNAAAIPLAMFGFLSPILSALAMGLSDLVVIGNALRLRRHRGLHNQ